MSGERLWGGVFVSEGFLLNRRIFSYSKKHGQGYSLLVKTTAPYNDQLKTEEAK